MQVDRRILVVPDIHQAPNLEEVEAAIARERPDLTVFLGDFFDQWDDTPLDAGETAEWLSQSIKQSNRVHLFGNHDLPYAYPGCKGLVCPGWTSEKYQAVKVHLSESDWTSLKMAHWERDLLFTHAGWSKSCTPVDSRLFQKPQLFLDQQIAEAWAEIPHGGFHWIFLPGRGRGGLTPCGGLTWCDLREFRAIPGVNQIFGHTPGNLGLVSRDHGTENWICDTSGPTGVRNYLIVDENAVHAFALNGTPVRRALDQYEAQTSV
jgi:hypothetical protein